MKDKKRETFFGILITTAFLMCLFAASGFLAKADGALQLKIITPPQVLVQGVLPAAPMAVQLQAQDGTPITASSSISLLLNSTSGTGIFFGANSTSCTSPLANKTLTLSSGTGQKRFCYQDPTVGSFALTVSASGFVQDTQQIVITASSAPVDYTALAAEIALAQSKLDTAATGTEVGRYPQSAVDALRAAISVSVAIQNNTAYTQIDVDNAVGVLNSAIADFDAAKIVSVEDPEPTPNYLTKSFDVKIISFLPNPAGEDAGKEWVDLVNNTSTAVLLDGWLLDDKSAGSGPGSDAYALSGLIGAGQTKRILLPNAAFALNNSGGDEVNLYFSDKTLADQAVYSEAAPDDAIFKLIEGIWQPPVVPPSGGGQLVSQTSGSSYGLNTVNVQTNIRINEFMPNPPDIDSGKEWVEIYNFGNASTSLEGWKLDNLGTSDKPSSASYVLDSSFVAPPQGYLVVSIQSGRFTLKNSGSDGLRLFKPDGSLFECVKYADSPKGQSYNFVGEDKWSFGFPTPGLPNNIALPDFKLKITEVLPEPVSGEDEFVELKNMGEEKLSLKGFALQIGIRKVLLDESKSLDPQGFLALYEDELPVKLRNSGQTLILTDPFERKVQELSYGPSKPGQSFALTDSGNYEWTQASTPGRPNVFVLGEEMPAQNSSQEPVSVKQPTNANLVKLLNKSLKSEAELSSQLKDLQFAFDGLKNQLSNPSLDVKQAAAASKETHDLEGKSKIYAGLEYAGLVAAALGILAWLVKKI